MQKRNVWREQSTCSSRHFLHLQQFAFVRVGRFDVSFGQIINLPPEMSVLLPDPLHLCLSLGGRAARFETQPADDGLFRTFGCHGYSAGVEEVT